MAHSAEIITSSEDLVLVAHAPTDQSPQQYTAVVTKALKDKDFHIEPTALAVNWGGAST